MKPKSSGPKNPKPNDPAKSLEELESNNLKKSIGYAAPVITAMGAAAAAMFPKNYEAKADRQQTRAKIKENKADRIEDSRPKKAENLRERAAVLSKKAEANKKIAANNAKGKK
jgi:hypothetical protein